MTNIYLDLKPPHKHHHLSRSGQSGLLVGELISVGDGQGSNSRDTAGNLGSSIHETTPEIAAAEDQIGEGGTHRHSGVKVTTGDGTDGKSTDNDAETNSQTVEVVQSAGLGGAAGQDGEGQNTGEDGLSEEDVPPGEGAGGANVETGAKFLAGQTEGKTSDQTTTSLSGDVRSSVLQRHTVTSTLGEKVITGKHSNGDRGVQVSAGHITNAVDGAHERSSDGQGSGMELVDGSADVQTDGEDQHESAKELGDQFGGDITSRTGFVTNAEFFGANHVVQHDSTGRSDQLGKGESERPAVAQGNDVSGNSNRRVKASTGDSSSRETTSDNGETNGETVEFLALIGFGDGSVQNAKDEETGIQELDPAALEPSEGSDGGDLKGLAKAEGVRSSGGHRTKELKERISGEIPPGEFLVDKGDSERHGGIEMTARNVAEGIDEDHQSGSDGEGAKRGIIGENVASDGKGQDVCADEFSSVLARVRDGCHG